MLCLTISTPLPIAKTANKKPNSLSLKLLHRSSIPSFENEDFQDFLEKNKQLSLKDSKFSTTTPLYQPTIEYLYFVYLSIGNPAVPQYLAVDTGSSLVWVTSNSTNKKFVYRRGYSKTYTSVSCKSLECSLCPNFLCSPKSDLCLYHRTYADPNSKSNGILAFERFVFTINECDYCGEPSLDKVLFGVATFTSGSLFQGSNFNGMLGLGPQSTSLLRNFFPQKLSYCIPDIFNTSSQLGFLELGDTGDQDESMYVPFYHDQYYRTNMDSINVGDECLNINPDIFKYDSTDPYTGVVFDTGAVFTFLADEAYDALVMKSRGYVEPQDKDTQLCYEGLREGISDFPLLRFHFVDKDVNADLSLIIGNWSLFYNYNPLKFCITMIKSSSKDTLYTDFTIIGLMAQQYHTMIFDLETSRMSIEYTSCIS
ncbi:aspartyl protease UND-like [Apium graveolens]|uniref:aspartyl protease UND-like n=1 Tax=Apium graveolens TaxID=4045 RepID=UPI003D7A2002